MKKISSIYIIDDDPIVVFGMRKMLENIAKCEKLHTFENGKLAIDSIQNSNPQGEEIPQIIFLDINMPIMDGWQFLKEFIAINLDRKIVINIITSSIDSLDEQNWNHYKNQTHHTITYNRKPIRKEDLTKMIENS